MLNFHFIRTNGNKMHEISKKLECCVIFSFSALNTLSLPHTHAHAHSLALFIKCCLLSMKYNLVDLFLNIKLLFYGRLFHQTAVLSLLRVFYSTWVTFSKVLSGECRYNENKMAIFGLSAPHNKSHARYSVCI